MNHTEGGAADELRRMLEYIARSLVENKESVSVIQKSNGEAVEFVLKVDESDMGKIIGRQGRIAKSIRAVLKAVSSRSGIRCTLEIG